MVAFIATNKNETLECHAFLTSKKKIAQACALTISQAFTIAFEKWQAGKGASPREPGDEKNSNTQLHDANRKEHKAKDEPALIDLSEENVAPAVTNANREFDFDLDDSFSRLAESRTNRDAKSFALPNNVMNVNVQDLQSYLNYNEKDTKFFNDDSPDDLFSL